jgi:hypothetical protein
MGTHSGRCLCGAVTFTARNVDSHFHICHCGMCRRWSGGPLMFVRAEGVEFFGTENLTRFKSSEWAERGFCKKCGSNLLYFLLPANQSFFSVGSFDDASGITLGSEIFIDHKPSSYEFAGEHKKMTEAEVLAQWS